MKSPRSLLIALAAALATGAAVAAPLPSYPTPGSPNATSYSFTAPYAGTVTAYFAGTEAGHDLKIGLLVNGVPTGVSGLPNHSSAVGTSISLGSVGQNDTLVFALYNLTLNDTAYSVPAMNTSYDLNGSMGNNHVYSAPFAGDAGLGIPAGTFVAFEDLRLPATDFDFNDHTFVFRIDPLEAAPVPEPATLTLFGLTLAGAAGYSWHRRRAVTPAAPPA